MELTSTDFGHNERIPDHCAFGIADGEGGIKLSDNRNPQLSWQGVPEDAQSLVLICVDSDVPSVADDVNKSDAVIPADLPRVNFYHWVMVDIPAADGSLDAGACSDGITPRGKQQPAGPAGSRQGVTDYTNWFAGDPDMAGDYYGYDGPCPPFNDELLHNYHFILYALDIPRCDVEDKFTAAEAEQAMAGHVVAQARLTGTFSTNPAVS